MICQRAHPCYLMDSLLYCLGLFLLAACNIQTPGLTPTPAPVPLAKELIFYDWEEDMPQAVLDAFQKEYGVQIRYLIYQSQEEAVDKMRTGQVYDVVVMDSQLIPLLVRDGLLVRLNQKHLPNLKNISANFRELAYDPNNDYSIPYNWGTTGLVVRSDLVDEPVTHWADLWDPRYARRVGIWMGETREVIGLALKSLGYSANSENSAELQKALQRLIKLKSQAIPLENYDLNNSADAMTSGQLVISMGYAADAVPAREQNPAITYILPEEGALLWNDTFIIPANSSHQATAEMFLNFLLRADINAMIANDNFYATANETALPLIEPEILHNPIIFPPNQDLDRAELILPLTLEGQKLYDEIWQQFTSSP